jgi:hypothetical protein
MNLAVSCGGGRQARDSQQIVGGGDQVGVPLHPRASAVGFCAARRWSSSKPYSIRLRIH